MRRLHATLLKGQAVIVGERHDGPESWNGWVYCRTTCGTAVHLMQSALNQPSPVTAWLAWLQDCSSKEALCRTQAAKVVLSRD